MITASKPLQLRCKPRLKHLNCPNTRPSHTSRTMCFFRLFLLGIKPASFP